MLNRLLTRRTKENLNRENGLTEIDELYRKVIFIDLKSKKLYLFHLQVQCLFQMDLKIFVQHLHYLNQVHFQN